MTATRTGPSRAPSVANGFKYGHNGNLCEEGNTVGQTTDYVYLDPSSPTDATYPVALIGLATSGGTTTETTYYVHADRIGTPQKVTDSTQAVKWTTTYLPFSKAEQSAQREKCRTPSITLERPPSESSFPHIAHSLVTVVASGCGAFVCA